MAILVRFLVVGLVLAGWSVAGAPPAGACSCFAGDGDVGGRLADADAAFVGRLLFREEHLPMRSTGDPARFTFAVERVAKGTLGERVVVDSVVSSVSCGLGVRRGERAGLLLEATSEGWRSGLCNMVAPGELLIASAGGVAPVPDAPVGGSGENRGGALPIAGAALGLATLAAVAAGGVAWRRRRAGADGTP